MRAWLFVGRSTRESTTMKSKERKMRLRLLGLAGAAAMMLSAFPAVAGGDLHIFNWGDYTNPKLIEKFQNETGIKVTMDTYDSNETMLAKVRAGGTGYDIVVPSDYTVKIMIEEGMLAETKPNEMANFKNVKPEFVDIYWDKGRNYTVPWQFGTTAFVVNTDKYKGDINTLAILFDPPPELKGRINMLDDEMSVIHAAERYLGVPRCGGDPANLKKVNDLLERAKIFQNFVMDPENAALISDFAGYGNGIIGSDKYMPEEFANAPEIHAPAGSPTPEFVPPCPPEVVKTYNAIWTNLRN